MTLVAIGLGLVACKHVPLMPPSLVTSKLQAGYYVGKCVDLLSCRDAVEAYGSYRSGPEYDQESGDRMVEEIQERIELLEPLYFWAARNAEVRLWNFAFSPANIFYKCELGDDEFMCRSGSWSYRWELDQQQVFKEVLLARSMEEAMRFGTKSAEDFDLLTANLSGLGQLAEAIRELPSSPQRQTLWLALGVTRGDRGWYEDFQRSRAEIDAPWH